MLEKEIIKEGNDTIRIFMGYKFHKQVLEDFSDCGGIYDIINIYSKTEIEYDEYPDDQVYLKTGWWGNNTNNFFYTYENCDIEYNTSWDWLIPVAKKCAELINDVSEEKAETLFTSAYNINKCLLEMEIEELWKAVVKFIKIYIE